MTYAAHAKEHPYRVTMLVLCIFVTLVWTAQNAGQYDTGLYHAQAIHWIEEYGIVPGLGNLHMRLAYNSAFMCLQALFSMQWLLGQSLHTLNGFLCVFGLGYAVMTIRQRQDQGWQTSDLLRCVIIVYIVFSRYSISSSGTDIWALLLVAYICTKWCEFAEDMEESAAPWCFICLVGIYALTVKLSAAVIVLLTVYPVYLLIQQRNIKRILGNVAAAVVIVLPFLIRNVIISGYLLYPYASIDLFSVDWKMDERVLTWDSMLIRMWGRGITNTKEHDIPWIKWLPRWFDMQGITNQIITVVGVICVFVLIYQLLAYIRMKRIRESIFVTTILLCLVFWFGTAPLMRYGIVYFMIIIAVAVGIINGRKRNIVTDKIITITLMLVMVPFLSYYIGKTEGISESEGAFWVKQTEYLSWPATQQQVGNVMIWTPDEGDLLGYFDFPGTPVREQLLNLELRGESFREGFRCIQKAED